jgi:hypothetical protein
MVSRLIGCLGFHLLIVLVGDILGDNLVRGGLLLLPQRGNLAIDG